MPFCRLRLRGSKPRPRYPKELKSLADHLRTRRLDLGLGQDELARCLGVHLATLSSWECHRTEPPIQFVPRLVAFIGYDPAPGNEGLAGRLAAYRRKHGRTFVELAERIGLDKETLAGIENGRRKLSRRVSAILARIV